MKLILLLAFVPLISGLGAPEAADVDDEEVKKATSFALDRLNEKKAFESQREMSDVQIISATKQLVSGYVYDVVFQVGSGKSLKECEIKVYETWSKTRELEKYVCKPKVFGKLGEEKPANLDPDVQNAVAAAMRYHNARLNNYFMAAAQSVSHVTKQTVAGVLYKFTVRVVDTICPKTEDNLGKGLDECPANSIGMASDCTFKVHFQIWKKQKYNINEDCEPAPEAKPANPVLDMKKNLLEKLKNAILTPDETLPLFGVSKENKEKVTNEIDSFLKNPKMKSELQPVAEHIGQSLFDAFSELKKHKNLLGGDDHDYQPHESLLGGDDHDLKQHGKQGLLGGDGHDLKPHGKQDLLGGDDHDLKQHGKQGLLGGDGHDLKPHGKQGLLGGDDHDLKQHGKQGLLGGDGHDLKPHGKQGLLGGDDHDFKPHGGSRVLLGGDDHGGLLGGDDHDLKPHGKQVLIGGDNHDLKPHGKQGLLGGDGHDLEFHGNKIGGDDHDMKNHGKVLCDRRMFKEFQIKHNHFYLDNDEENKRFEVFCQNMKTVEELKRQEQGTATYGATKFADLTPSEFQQKYLSKKTWDKIPNYGKSRMSPAKIPSGTPPKTFDWRDHGAVTPVKNQGQCGSCWAFSTTGNIEGQWKINKGKLYSLSEQELVDCDKLDDGCNGGLPSNAYVSIMKLGGLETESEYKYEGEDEKCMFNKTEVKVDINGAVNISSNEDEMAAWLAQNGPISIGINAFAMQFYFGGISHPFSFLCNPKNLDHGVLIVGYGVEGSEPYWIIKNSWGEDWGEKGYYLVYRGGGVCGLNTMCTSAVVNKT